MEPKDSPNPEGESKQVPQDYARSTDYPTTLAELLAKYKKKE
jgi:hypothetical protein